MNIFLLIIATLACMNAGATVERDDRNLAPGWKLFGLVINLVLAGFCYYFVLRG